MPTSTIPYDPSLVLGMVIDPKKIKNLEKIADLQKPVNDARDQLDALLRQKYSLDLTLRELESIGANEQELSNFEINMKDIVADIVKAASHLAKVVMTAERQIAKEQNRQAQNQISSHIESPVDFSASQLKPMPLSSDSIDMDVQYFRFEKENDVDKAHASAAAHASAISKYVGGKISKFLGPEHGKNMASSAYDTVVQMSNEHSLEGIVVSFANCTHRTAQVFAPLVLDVENAMASWTKATNESWQPQKIQEMRNIAVGAITKEDEDNGLPVLAGATYGSSFVGMVHFTKTDNTNTSSNQSADALARSVKTEIEMAMYVGGATGGKGLDKQTAKSLRELLSNSTIDSHCSVIAMGLIPSIQSNNVITAVRSLDPDPVKYMTTMQALQGDSDQGLQSVAKIAQSAKDSETVSTMSSDFIKASVEALAAEDKISNSVIDMNSLMTALDDYLKQASSGKTSGVPINFYVKSVTKQEIAVQWMKKYYPELLHPKVKSTGDDDDQGS